jgi:hypothetical protein
LVQRVVDFDRLAEHGDVPRVDPMSSAVWAPP